MSRDPEIMPEHITSGDRQAIADLQYKFFWLIDDGRADETLSLFAPEAALTFGPNSPAPGTIEGAQLEQAMIERASQKDVSTRHVLSNLRYLRLSDGKVRLRSLLTLFRCDDGINAYTLVADIDEIYIKLGGVWLLKSRLVSPVFKLPSD